MPTTRTVKPAAETLEDYNLALRAGIALVHDTLNALLAIAFAAAVIFITGLPLAYYGARYNIDLDLITRGAGFGYYLAITRS